MPAWETLGALQGRQGTLIGGEYHRLAGELVAAVAIAPSPTSLFLAEWDGQRRRIAVSPDVIGEDHRVAASAIVYGLCRAEQDARLSHLSCIEREADALSGAAQVRPLFPPGLTFTGLSVVASAIHFPAFNPERWATWLFFGLYLAVFLAGLAGYVRYERASDALLSRAARGSFDDLSAPERAATA